MNQFVVPRVRPSIVSSLLSATVGEPEDGTKWAASFERRSFADEAIAVSGLQYTSGFGVDLVMNGSRSSSSTLFRALLKALGSTANLKQSDVRGRPISDQVYAEAFS